MSQSVEVSVLTIDATIQAFEELMNAVDEEQIQPDHQAVLSELHELVRGSEDANEEEATDAPVEEDAGEEVAEEAVSEE